MSTYPGCLSSQMVLGVQQSALNRQEGRTVLGRKPDLGLIRSVST